MRSTPRFERHRLARARVRRHAAEEHIHRAYRSAPRYSRMRARTVAGRDCARVHSGLKSNRESATRSTRLTTRPAGTSRRRPACSEPPPRWASYSGSRRNKWFEPSGSRRHRPPASARCSARWRSRSNRAAPRRTATPPRCSAAPTSRPASAPSKGREASRPSPQPSTTSIRSRRGSASISSCATTHTSPVRARRASDDRRLQPAAPRAPSVARFDRGRTPARRAPGARPVQQEHLAARAREQVLDLSRRRDRARARQGRLAGIHRRGRRGSGARRVARSPRLSATKRSPMTRSISKSCCATARR